MKKINPLSASMYTLMASASLTNPLSAGGYQLKTVNTPSLGQANAGTSVEFGSVEFLSRNPALIAHMKKHQAAAAVSVVIPSIKFKNQGSTLFGSNIPIQGGNGGQAAKSAAVPAAYLGYSYNDRLKFALGVTSEWGLGTSYDEGWVGRYHNLESKMSSVIIEPAVAYKLNEYWALGAGVNIQYIDVKLTRAVDTSSILLANAPAALGALTAVGLAPDGSARNDANVKLKGDQWGVGGSFGITFQPWKTTKFGLSYRSQVKQKLKGNKEFAISSDLNTRLNNLAGLGAATAALVGGVRRNLTNADITANLTTPDTVLFGASHELTNEWTILGELNWTSWSNMKEIRVKTTSLPNISDDVTTLKWKDTLAYAVGFNYRPQNYKKWVYRTGFAYDPTPTRKEYRIPAVPDNDRYWFSAGVGYEQNAQWNYNLSYAYEYLPKSKSALRPAAGSSEAVRGNLNGKYTSGVHIISAQIGYRF